MKRKRRDLGTNIAFLDVMSCGLGAAVFLFLIVKHHTGSQPIIEKAVSHDGEVVTMLEQAEATLTDQINAVAEQITTREAATESNQQLIEDHRAKQTELAQLKIQLMEEEVRNSALQKEVVNIRSQQTADIIEDQNIGEEEYLIGMTVEGRRIAILLDRSASMTDAKLIDIIVRKLKPDASKRNGPKWLRAVRVLRWLLARLPESSQVAVVIFNDKAEILNQGAWADSRNAQQIGAMIAEIANSVPTGATNLEVALRAMARMRPAPTDVYIVTDGLPTQSASMPDLKSLCRKSAKNVSGRCRKELFFTSLDNSTWINKKINVILLPIEGDPEAAPLFWNWTAYTGGLLLVPAVGWP